MGTAPEFSRLIAVEGISPDKIRKESITASEKECAALAARFDLRELSNLKADIKIRRVEGGDVVRLEGAFSADVVQTCVVSLQEVHDHVAGSFDTYFADGKERYDGDGDDSLEGPDGGHDTMANGNIDLGEVVAQYLSLELNPYPRAPGVSLAAQLAEAGTEVKNNPFKVLQGLKEGKPAAAPATKKSAKVTPAAVKEVKAAKAVKKAAKPEKSDKPKKGKAK